MKAQSMRVKTTLGVLSLRILLVSLSLCWKQLFCGRVSSGAATVVDHHGRDLPIDDLLLAVEVQHVDGRHLGGRAAGPRGASWVGLVHQVCMWILLQVHEFTLPRAVVGPVALGGDDPVPAELLEVDGEWVAAAARLCRFLVTVEARVSAGSLGVVEDLHFDERLLERKLKCWKLLTTFLTWQWRIYSFHYKFLIADSN